MSDMIFKCDNLISFSQEILKKLGLNENDAKTVSKILIEADLRGISSHGIARLPIYAKRIEYGLINPKPAIKVLKENQTSALLDADNGMGHIASYQAMELCIKKAKISGTASVAVKNSNHFGINAYYTMMATKANLIGMAFTNTSPLMAPFGGRERLLGSNPLSIAIPAGNEPDVVIDMATSVAARGKLEVAERKGESIPKDWAIDEKGEATIDPRKGLAGALLPFGGPKGYGLAIFVDIVSGIITGSNFGPNCGSLFEDLDRPQNIGHFFLAINIENFIEIKEFKKKMDIMIQNIKTSKKAVGFQRIYMPGEIEYDKHIELLKNGIKLSENTIEQLNKLAQNLGVPNRLS